MKTKTLFLLLIALFVGVAAGWLLRPTTVPLPTTNTPLIQPSEGMTGGTYVPIVAPGGSRSDNKSFRVSRLSDVSVPLGGAEFELELKWEGGGPPQSHGRAERVEIRAFRAYLTGEEFADVGGKERSEGEPSNPADQAPKDVPIVWANAKPPADVDGSIIGEGRYPLNIKPYESGNQTSPTKRVKVKFKVHSWTGTLDQVDTVFVVTVRGTGNHRDLAAVHVRFLKAPETSTKG